MEMKRADLSKPYDPKKSIWVPEEGGGYVEALLESEGGGKTIAMVGHEVTTIIHIPVGQFLITLHLQSPKY